MKHSGEILKSVVEGSGVPISRIAKQLGVDRSTIYRTYDRAEVSLDFILKIGKIINKDMSVYFPEVLQAVQEAPLNYNSPKSYSELLDEAKYWKDKYIDVLERYNKLLNEHLYAEKLRHTKAVLGEPVPEISKEQLSVLKSIFERGIEMSDEELAQAKEEIEKKMKSSK